MRLYDSDKGEVLFDGFNVRELDVLWLRSNFGVVTQEPQVEKIEFLRIKYQIPCNQLQRLCMKCFYTIISIKFYHEYIINGYSIFHSSSTCPSEKIFDWSSLKPPMKRLYVSVGIDSISTVVLSID